jgi:hypothetical protein
MAVPSFPSKERESQKRWNQTHSTRPGNSHQSLRRLSQQERCGPELTDSSYHPVPFYYGSSITHARPNPKPAPHLNSVNSPTYISPDIWILEHLFPNLIPFVEGSNPFELHMKVPICKRIRLAFTEACGCLSAWRVYYAMR